MRHLCLLDSAYIYISVSLSLSSLFPSAREKETGHPRAEHLTSPVKFGRNSGKNSCVPPPLLCALFNVRARVRACVRVCGASVRSAFAEETFHFSLRAQSRNHEERRNAPLFIGGFVASRRVASTLSSLSLSCIPCVSRVLSLTPPSFSRIKERAAHVGQIPHLCVRDSPGE